MKCFCIHEKGVLNLYLFQFKPPFLLFLVKSNKKEVGIREITSKVCFDIGLQQDLMVA